MQAFLRPFFPNAPAPAPAPQQNHAARTTRNPIRAVDIHATRTTLQQRIDHIAQLQEEVMVDHIAMPNLFPRQSQKQKNKQAEILNLLLTRWASALEGPCPKWATTRSLVAETVATLIKELDNEEESCHIDPMDQIWTAILSQGDLRSGRGTVRTNSPGRARRSAYLAQCHDSPSWSPIASAGPTKLQASQRRLAFALMFGSGGGCSPPLLRDMDVAELVGTRVCGLNIRNTVQDMWTRVCNPKNQGSLLFNSMTVRQRQQLFMRWVVLERCLANIKFSSSCRHRTSPISRGLQDALDFNMTPRDVTKPWWFGSRLLDDLFEENDMRQRAMDTRFDFVHGRHCGTGGGVSYSQGSPARKWWREQESLEKGQRLARKVAKNIVDHHVMIQWRHDALEHQEAHLWRGRKKKVERVTRGGGGVVRQKIAGWCVASTLHSRAQVAAHSERFLA